MLSTRLVKLIETHAQDLSKGVVTHLQSHARTPSLHRYPEGDLRERAYMVYRHLGDWLGANREEHIQEVYQAFGERRCHDGLPLSEIIFALAITKEHLIEFARTSAEGMNVLEVHGECELLSKVSRFFDLATYYTAIGYEQAAAGKGSGHPEGHKQTKPSSVAGIIEAAGFPLH